MSEQIAERENSAQIESPKLKAKPISVWMLILLLAVTALVVQQVWWSIFLLVELVFVIGIGEVLAMNLPRRIRQQIDLNIRRADGSKSARRAEIEKACLSRFKFSVMTCFAFTVIPINACILVYGFLLPFINRFNETVVIGPNEKWKAILLEPAVHIIFLVAVLAMFSFDSLKGIFFRLLKDLDDEVSLRAENYAVHDLINPPKDRQRDHRKRKASTSHRPLKARS